MTRPDRDRSGPQIIKTDEDRNRGPVNGPLWIQKFQDRAKTGLTGQRPVFKPSNSGGLEPWGLNVESIYLELSYVFDENQM